MMQRKFLSGAAALALFLGACGDDPKDDVTPPDNPVHEAHPDVVPISIEMAEPDLEELYSRDIHSRDRLPASVFLGEDDAELDVRGMRFRGSTTRAYPKKGYNIRLEERPELEAFPEFNFRGDTRDAGNRLALNALWTDPTGMREALNFGMFEELGLPTIGTYYADLTINGNFEGFYIGLERVDRELLKGLGLHRTKGEFTMIRDQSKSNRHLADVSDRSIFGFDIDSVLSTDEERIELIEEVFKYRGDAEDTNWEGVLELIRWAHATPAGAQWLAEFDERFDVDAFIDFLAIHILTHDRDSMDIDFWLYRDESPDAADGRWKFIPWDKNLTFGAHYFTGHLGENDFFDYDRIFLETMGNGLVVKSLQTPELRARLDNRLIELMEETFNTAYFEAKIAELKPIVRPSIERSPGPNAYILHPKQHQGPAGFLDDHLASLIDFIELRYEYLERQINTISGEAYEAEAEITDAKTGDIIFLTDAKGWVIARLELEEDINSATLSAKVEEKSGLEGIDRIWSVEVDGADISAKLSLYYRNTPLKNWYEEEEPIGRQRELLMNRVDDEGALEALSTDVNPYSNRVEAAVDLSGSQQFVVVY